MHSSGQRGLMAGHGCPEKGQS